MVASPPSNVRRLRVFLCHAFEDKAQVRELYEKLCQAGVDPWLDDVKLLPGQEWRYEIRKAIRASDIFIVCLSGRSITKTGFVQKEIRDALDLANEKPPGTIFIIPLRLEECDVPELLSRYHWANLLEYQGYNKLLHTLRQEAQRLRAHVPAEEVTLETASRLVWTVSASPPLARAEGLCELVADITIQVPGWFETRDIFDIQVFLNANITSPLLRDGHTKVTLMAEAVSADYLPSQQVIMGKMVGVNTVLFEDVWIMPLLPQKLRIVNLRANALQAGVTGAGLGQLFAHVSARPKSGTQTPVLENSQQLVGIVRPGSTFDIRHNKGDVQQQIVISRSTGINEDLLDDQGAARPAVTFGVEFQQVFWNAFRSRAEEAGASDVEFVTNGTRFLCRFSGISENVHVFVTTRDVDSDQRSPRAVLIGTNPTSGSIGISDVSGVGPVGQTRDGVPIAELPISSGSCSAVWEWVAPRGENAAASFGVVVAARAGQAGLSVTPVTVIGTLAPLSTVTAASHEAEVPRFGDVSSARDAFEVRE